MRCTPFGYRLHNARVWDCQQGLSYENFRFLYAPLIGERASAGRAAAKAKGVRFGPKPVLTPEQIAHARRLIDEGQSVAEVARLLGVHRATLYRALPQ